MKTVDWIISRVVAGLHFISTLMLIGIVLVNAANVVGRYVFNQPIEMGDELMTFMLTVAVFLCLPRCTYEDVHIRMDLIRNHVSGLTRKVLDLLLELVHFCLALMIVYVGVPTVSQLLAWGQVSEAAKIPMWTVHSVVPVGFGLVGLILLYRLVRLLRRREPT